MDLKVYPIEFIRELERKHKINLDAEYHKYELAYPLLKETYINTNMQDDIIKSCMALRIDYKDVVGKTRKEEPRLLRQYLMDFMYTKYPVSLKAIGAKFSNRDHSTVINARGIIRNLKETNYPLLSYYESVLSNVLSPNLLPLTENVDTYNSSKINYK